MAKKREHEYREPDGRYAYFGDMSRMCRCSHVLGAHIAGGFECGHCDCQKFKPVPKNKYKGDPRAKE